jgi:hypothetical protein
MVRGITCAGGKSDLGGVALDIVRYKPTNPVDGPPFEYRDDLYPFTTWTLSLTKSSHMLGFSSSIMPVFDPSRPRSGRTFDQITVRPRLVGMYEEWTIPFWFLFLITAMFPAVSGIRRTITNHGGASAISFARVVTVTAFLLFLVALSDHGRSADFELILSLLLAGCGLVTAVIIALSSRR